MIKKFHLTMLLLSFLITTKLLAQKSTLFNSEFTPMWNRATKYTIEVAQQMPEEYYNFRPNEDTFTFAQQMAHIITNLYWLNSTFVLNESNPIKDANLDELKKDDLIKYFEDASKYVAKSASGLSDKQISSPIIFAGEIMKKKHIFYLMRDHLTHHRAQTIVYLRLNGMKPPKYVGW